ncbi:hypothetical protein IEO21_10333 [Rhodonia placenta]|uniref:Uncharacterized protein n=1 Tax=Rhodonia placenta TaxID=104341 RepID=A0A8H7NSN0_9APHY|nr:hypothetical protein IEO21_10333 [Postia placenta]
MPTSGSGFLSPQGTIHPRSSMCGRGELLRRPAHYCPQCCGVLALLHENRPRVVSCRWATLARSPSKQGKALVLVPVRVADGWLRLHSKRHSVHAVSLH